MCLYSSMIYNPLGRVDAHAANTKPSAGMQYVQRRLQRSDVGHDVANDGAEARYAHVVGRSHVVVFAHGQRHRPNNTGWGHPDTGAEDT